MDLVTEWSGLSFAEQQFCRKVMNETYEQLVYALDEMTDEEYKDVKFFLVQDGMISYVIPRQFFIDVVNDELTYREDNA